MSNDSLKILAITGSIPPGSTSQYIEAAKGRLDSARMIYRQATGGITRIAD